MVSGCFDILLEKITAGLSTLAFVKLMPVLFAMLVGVLFAVGVGVLKNISMCWRLGLHWLLLRGRLGRAWAAASGGSF